MMDTPTKTRGVEADVTLDIRDVKALKAIETASGWHNISNAEKVHSAFGVARSPVMPDRLFAALRYTNEYGKEATTPLRNILSYSEEEMPL